MERIDNLLYPDHYFCKPRDRHPSELLSLKQVIYDLREREFLSLILPRSKTPVMRTVVQGDECDPPPGWDAR